MAVPAVKLSKLRTFRDDFTRAQIQKTGKSKPVAETAVPKSKIPSAPLTRTKPLNIPKELTEAKTRRDQKPVELTTPRAKTPAKAIPRIGQEVDLKGVKRSDKESLMASGGKEINVMEATAEVGEGNIITDQKRKRFRLLPAMVEAFRGWLGDTKETVTEMAKPKEPDAVIKPASERKGLIVQAAEQSAQAPRDDRRNLFERFTRTGHGPPTEHKDTFKIKKREEVPPPAWTHLKEDAATKTDSAKAAEAALRSAAPTVPVAPPAVAEAAKPPAVEVTPPVGTVPPVVKEVTETAPAPVTKPTPAEVPEPEVPVTPTEVEPTPVVEETAPEPVAVQPIASEPEPVVEPEPIVPIDEAPVPVDEVPPYVPPPVPARAAKPRTDLVFSPWRVGAVVTFSVLLGVSAALWLFSPKDEGILTSSDEAAVESLVRSEAQVPVELGNSTNDFLRNLLAAEPPSSVAVAQLYPTANISGEATPATAEQIMTVLAPQAPNSFIRSVTAINFGLYRDREPFIIMRTTAFDTAFGGILEWEESMSADLSPFFGAPVSGTFDPRSRSATQIREPYFVDVVVGNLDARLLTDETQKERLIYAFVDRNLILITTNEETLEALVNVVR